MLRVQQTLGAYTAHDSATLSAALDGFPLDVLGEACNARVAALHAITDGGVQAYASIEGAPGRVRTDQATFLVLAYACSLNHGRWFVKNEARRLMAAASGLTALERVALLALLQVEVQPMDAAVRELEGIAAAAKRAPLSRAQSERGRRLQGMVRCFAQHVVATPPGDVTPAQWQAFHAVDFEHASRLVASRQVTLHAGLAYVQDWQLQFVLRQTYEARLTALVRQCRVRLDEISRTNTGYHAPQFATLLSIMHDVQFRVCPVVAVELGPLDCSARSLPLAIARFAPLCIVKLAVKLRVQRHLVDRERVTLRLWLRAVRVRLDVAVEFWQALVPEKENVRGAIAQAYAKQYACVGCAKIRAQDLCPLQGSPKSISAWCAETMPSAARDIEDLVASTQCPSERCAGVFALRHGDGMRSGPRNPANYFARAAEAGLQ